MFRYLQDQLAIRRWKKSVIGNALRDHCHSFFYASDAPLRYFSDDAKLNHSAHLHTFGQQVVAAQNPSKEVRELLCNHSIAFAQFMAVALTKEEKEEHPVYSDSPYISGELSNYIDQIVPHFEELDRYRFEEGDVSNADLIAFCNTRSAVLLFYANGLNLIRICVEGTEKNPEDWYKAMVQALVVSEESRFREKLDLPSLLPDSLDGLAYGMFFEYVISGEPNPLYAWTKAWPNKYLFGHGPKSPIR